ncbi:MAG: macro domain-containing protein [Planctomycetota bacterium]|nr:macro domain-containing protein [Planctomycetota bacterium]
MIEPTEGNILEADAEALVNTVNCVGYMGKGIALQFKQAFPDNFKAYEKACRAEKVKPGRMFVFPTGTMVKPKYIINFPTKRHWRGASRIEDIRAGLRALAEEVKRLGIRSIAIPPLGCGNGLLSWWEVRPMIEKAVEAIPDVRVVLFEPRGAPNGKAMPVRTERPKMTLGRALVIKLMHIYAALGYSRTLLEIHKLAYFLQESAEPLRLRYEAGLYGPYAANLNKVLERIEGHFIRGYGDSQKPDTEIEILQGAVEQADRFLATKPASRERLERVADLIEGFETPYGMELLSSVHWVAKHGKPPAETTQAAIEAVHAWNDRKRNMFQDEHIRIAWDQLRAKDWLS